MISVTQPRKPADDFLSTLQANLQGNRRSRRRAQAHPVATISRQEKTSQATKAPNKAVTRPPVNNSSKGNVAKERPIRHGKKAATGVQRQQDVADQAPPPLAPAAPASSLPQHTTTHPQPAPTNHSLPVQLAPQTQNNPNPYYQNTVPVNQMGTAPGMAGMSVPGQTGLAGSSVPGQYAVPPPQQPARQNNFYFKNKSNIFDTGYAPWSGTNNTAHMHHNTQSVVDNAIRIASQQPLPPAPSFPSPRYQDRPVAAPNPAEIIQQYLPSSVPAQQYLPSSVPNTAASVPASSDVAGKPINSHYTQSFSIGGNVSTDNNKTTKELERRKWIQDLENQIREKKEREKQEKSGGWGDPSPRSYQQQQPQHQQQQPPVFQQPYTIQHDPANFQPQQTVQCHSLQPQHVQPQPLQPQHLQPQHLIHPQNLQQPQNTQPQKLQYSQNLHPSPHPSHHLQLGQHSPMSQTPVGGYLLGQNSGVDPLELERRQEARKRALENQEIIRQQVEERERLKREATERRKREEEGEMKRIDEEKVRMAREVQEELQKNRKKEAAQLEQIQEMRRKIEEANKTAADIKRSKRQRLHSEDRYHNKQEVVAGISPSLELINEKAQSRTPASLKMEVVDSSTRSHPVVLAPPQHIVQYPQAVAVRYVSNATTQTVVEASCQTITREGSFLPSESKLIKLQDRELSAVQHNRAPTNQQHKRANEQEKRAGGQEKRAGGPATKPPGGPPQKNNRPPPGKPKQSKAASNKPARQANVEYDKHGRRVRQGRDDVLIAANKVQTPGWDTGNIIAEESVTVEEYRSIADIFDDPQPSIPPRFQTAEQSHYTLPNGQIQMRYLSPQNEERAIPSVISVRQNDILNQLEKLRLGLRDRRRNVSSQESGTR